MARRGRKGGARRCGARPGEVWRGFAGLARLVRARIVPFRHCMVRQERCVPARNGLSGSGLAWQERYGISGFVPVGYVQLWRGVEGREWQEWRGKSGNGAFKQG